MNAKTIAPFGQWPTPITPELVSGAALKLSFPMFTASGSVTWLESRPAESGRSVVVSTAGDLSPAPRNARSRVHEYGGLAHLFIGEDLYLVDQTDRGIYCVARGSEPRLVGPPDAWRLAEPVHDAHQNRLIAIGELYGADDAHPENGLVSVDLATGKVDWLLRGHDFFAFPRVSPGGETLAYLAWSAPHMPWDAAAVYTAAIASNGALAAPEKIAGGPDGSAFSPQWSPGGELYFALESMEAPWNVHRLRNGKVEHVCRADEEWGAPLWNLGTTLFGFSDAHTIVGAPMASGRSSLVRFDVETGKRETLIEDLGHIGQVAVRGRDVLLAQGWAGSATRLFHCDLDTLERQVLRDTTAHLFEGSQAILSTRDVPVAESVRFATSDGDEAHAFFYAPVSARADAPTGSLPPLMVLCHGGPTGVAAPLAGLGILQLTTRGFAVLDVNYRGSVGFGRAYREKLRGRWGRSDVDDCVFGARAMVERGRVDGRKLAIRGGSAGGYTLLLALARHPDTFSVATCLYGVSDPRSLTEATHKFESPYANFLFGTGAERERAFDERSPITLVDKIRTPVIFFQGMEDKAVLPEQTLRIHAALELRGVVTEIHCYEGEQHGFRKAETIRDVFEKEAAFYAKVFDLSSG